MTLIETLVVLALGTVVFGLILNTLVVTQRESDRLTSVELMHQEALLISQAVERTLRYRLNPLDLEAAYSGGAGPEGPAAGGAAGTTSTLPSSIVAVTSATLMASPAPMAAAPGTTSPVSTTATESQDSPATVPESHRADFTSAPASIQSILGTTTSATITPGVQNPKPAADSGAPFNSGNMQAVAAASASVHRSQPATSGQERFASDEVVVYSLGAGPDPSKLVVALRNSRGIGATPSHAFMEQIPAGGAFAPAVQRRSLGPNADKFQSQISFRFASSFNGTKARWTRESREVPRLVEYTVRVWPTNSGDSFEQAQQSNKPTPTFQLTSAVALQ